MNNSHHPECATIARLKRELADMTRKYGELQAQLALKRAKVCVEGIDTGAIREAALKATPGPWTDCSKTLHYPTPGFAIIAPHDGTTKKCVMATMNSYLDNYKADARHIATMNPQTTIALLDRIVELEQRNARLLKQNHNLANAGIDKVMTNAVQNTIADLTDERDKAVLEAKQYRNTLEEEKQLRMDLAATVENQRIQLEGLRLTNRQADILGARTGILCGPMDTLHEYIEKLLKRPVFSHELADESVWDKIKEAATDDFVSICCEQEADNERG